MIKTAEIVQVQYKRDIKMVNPDGVGVEYLENIVFFKDGNADVRNGIIRVYGETIKAKSESLKEATQIAGWWSLQSTSMTELKAAYRTGFRCLHVHSSLEAHVKEFEKGGTLHVQKMTEDSKQEESQNG